MGYTVAIRRDTTTPWLSTITPTICTRAGHLRCSDRRLLALLESLSNAVVVVVVVVVAWSHDGIVLFMVVCIRKLHHCACLEGHLAVIGGVKQEAFVKVQSKKECRRAPRTNQ